MSPCPDTQATQALKLAFKALGVINQVGSCADAQQQRAPPVGPRKRAFVLCTALPPCTWCQVTGLFGSTDYNTNTSAGALYYSGKGADNYTEASG